MNELSQQSLNTNTEQILLKHRPVSQANNLKPDKDTSVNNESLKSDPHYVWAVDKKTGEVNLVGKDKEGKSILINEEQLKSQFEPKPDKGQKWEENALLVNKDQDLISVLNKNKHEPEQGSKKPQLEEGGLEVLDNKGFLGNFIVNFQKNYAAASQYEFFASPVGIKLEEAYKAIKEEASNLKENVTLGIENLKKLGISGLDSVLERTFVFKPTEEQQEILKNYFQHSNDGKPFTISVNKELQIPTDKENHKRFFQYLASSRGQAPELTGEGELKSNVTTTIMQNRFDPNKINWEEAKKFGITKEILMQDGNLERLLNGEKTSLLQGLKGDISGVKVSLDRKLRLVNGPDGNPQFVFHGVKANLTVPKEFLGYAFSEEDKKNLVQNGELGKVVNLRDKISNAQYPAFIGVDRETKEIIALRAEKINIPNTIHGVELSDDQKRSLAEGKPTLITGLRDSQQNEFSAYAQVSVAKKGIEFKTDSGTAVKLDVLNVRVKDVLDNKNDSGIKKVGEVKNTQASSNSLKSQSSQKNQDAPAKKPTKPKLS